MPRCGTSSSRRTAPAAGCSPASSKCTDPGLSIPKDPISKATLGWPFSFALNRLLAAQPSARARLAPFAGRTVELRAPPLPSLRFVILPGGTVEAGGEQPALVVTLPPEALAAAPRGGEHFLRSLQVTGEAQLASAVMALARELRWDAEEDLSRVMGDVAAHRIAGLARALADWQRDAAGRLAASVRDYAVEEKRVLLSTAELQWFAGEVAGLRDAIERLEKRMGRLG